MKFNSSNRAINIALAAALMAFIGPAFAAGGIETRSVEFIENVVTILKTISIAAVTIAVMFAGYGIAFGGKRLVDVAPVLIGGFIIGAAGTIAVMVIG